MGGWELSGLIAAALLPILYGIEGLAKLYDYFHKEDDE